MKACVRYACAVGSAVAVLLFVSAGAAAKLWLRDDEAALPLRILALSIPFVAMSSALNGYFTAVRRIGRYSAVRILEQAVKICVVSLLMARLLPHGVRWGCVAIVAGIVVSEAFSYFCLHVLYNIEKQMYREKQQKFSLDALLHIALPDVCGAGARSVLLTVEHLLIPRGFRRSGASSETALTLYGNVHGMVFPMLLYPSAILSSLAGLLIPELAGRNAQGLSAQITYIIRRVLRMTLLFSFCAAGFFYVFADILSEVVYKTADCAFYLRILSVLVPVMYCDMTVDGMLKGLDQQRACMRYNIWDSGLCVVLVYILLPLYGMKGYIFILFFSEIFNYYFSLRRLCKVATVELNIAQDLCMPLLCGVCAPLSVSVLFRLSAFPEGAWTLAAGITASVGLYVLLLYGFGCLSPQDVRWFLHTCGLTRRMRLTRQEEFGILSTKGGESHAL